MAHRSGGGSHSGGHHSGGHHSSSHGGSGGNGARYSNKPFPNARRFRYYDRHGRERYLYGSQMPTKTSLFSLILSLIFFVPFIFGSIYSIVSIFLVLAPTRPLKPEYKPTDEHIMDGSRVIDDEDSLEEILQEFEDETGISPYVMTVYDEDWKNYDELWEYAYDEYYDLFDDEQHFLIVYSEPENAAKLDFVDWSWEGIQGDDTDRILTESNMEIFNKDLHDNFLRDNVSVGEAFEKTFKKSLTYVMKNNNGGEAAATILFVIVWNAFIFFAIYSVFKSYIIGTRDYQEVPIGGSANTASGTMGNGANAAYQNGTTYQGGAAYQSSTTTFQGDTNYQGGQGYQGGQVYQNGTAGKKRYMYYDKNGNKKYVSASSNPKSSALIIMIVILVITVPIFLFSAFLLFGCILMFSKAADASVASEILPMLMGVAVWNIIVVTVIIGVIGHYKMVKKREYIEVSNESFVQSGGAQYNAGTTNNNAAQYNSGMQSNATQYGAGAQYSAAQYNAAGASGNDYYNDDARFRSPEYYDDDARYRGSTAYEAGKK